MSASVRLVSTLGMVGILMSCAGARDPSSAAGSGEQCAVKSTDLAADLSFTLECPVEGQGWGWCSSGCPADLHIAYDAKVGGRGEQGTMVAPGRCDPPVGKTVTCRFPDSTTGEALGKEKARLEASASHSSGLGVTTSTVHLQWTDFEGMRRVDIEMQDPVHGRRRTQKIRLDPATAEKTVAAADRTIARREERQVAARDQAQASKVAEAKKEEERFATMASDCNGGKGEACFEAAKWLAARDTGSSMIGLSPAASQALTYMRKSCELGYQPGCEASQNARLEPTRRPQQNTMEQDAAPLQDRCRRGDNAACVVFQSISKCQQGLSEGCDSAGSAYLGALGGTRDVGKATSYWRRACQISAPRCSGYGVQLLRAGEQAAAFQMFDTGCHDDAEQCAVIGALLRQGPNAAKARDYLEKGCSGGSGTSCQMLRSR